MVAQKKTCLQPFGVDLPLCETDRQTWTASTIFYKTWMDSYETENKGIFDLQSGRAEACNRPCLQRKFDLHYIPINMFGMIMNPCKLDFNWCCSKIHEKKRNL